MSRRRGTIVVLGGLAAIGPFSGDTYLPAFPQIAADLGVEPVRVQLTLTASLLGLGVGQLVVGPLSDLWGRRRPLLAGLALYVLASLGCALAPSVETLIGLRFVQGLSGSAAVVLARAVVRDLYSGVAAARAFSQLMLVFGVAPVVAPLVGSAVLAAGQWRVIFLVLAGIGVLLLGAVALWLKESLPPERRGTGGLSRIPATFGVVLRDRPFLGYALSCGLAYAGMFAYIAGSPFVVQELHGASATVYGALFAVNATGLALVAQLNARLLRRFEPRRLLTVGIGAYTVAALVLFGTVVARERPGLVAIVPSMFVVVSSLGFVMANATALALARFPDLAGTASSIMGALHFALGASVAPLVGLGGAGTAVPFGATIAGAALAALLVLRALRPRPGV